MVKHEVAMPVLSPKEAVESVRDKDRTHRAKMVALNKVTGDNPQMYAVAKLDEEEAWMIRQRTRRFLSQHIIETYGVNVHDLVELTRG